MRTRVRVMLVGFSVLTASGEVYCWGANEAGRLGTGRGATSVAPVRVVGLEGMTP